MTEHRWTLDHVGLVVSDLKRSVDWYRGALRAEPRGERGRTSRLSLGNVDLVLTEAPPEAVRSYGLAANDAGAFHLCPRVDDLAVEYARLSELGIATTTPPAELVPGTGMRTVFLRDPDGVLIQLLELPPARADGRPAREVHHVGVTVSDLERAAAWHADVVGVPTLSWHENGGELLSQMFEVPETAERAALVDCGNTLLELMQWDHPVGRPYQGDATDVGAGHLCFAADGFEHDPPTVLEDPDGVRVELASTAMR